MNKSIKIIGIDVSKDTLDFYEERKGHIQVSNTQSGFKKAIAYYGTDGFYLMESTGSYHHRLAHFLHDQGISVSILNPLSVKRFIQMKLCRNKTDKSDAKMIAAYGHSQAPKVWSPPSEYLAMCEALQSVIQIYLKERTGLKNKLHSLLSKGLTQGIAVRSLKLSIKRLSVEIEKLEAEMEALVKDNAPELYTHLKSIPGVGHKTAMVLICATGGFSNFESSKKVISYLGLSPIEYSSGTSVRKQSRISKTGHPMVRNHLFLCSFTACKANPQCKALYDRIVAKGKSKKLALIAVCNKLIKQAFAIAKSGIPYDPNYKSTMPLIN